MMGTVLRMSITMILYALSLTLPLIFLIQLQKEKRLTAMPGIRWFSMPVGVGLDVPTLGGWEFFFREAAEVSLEPPEQFVESSSADTDRPIIPSLAYGGFVQIGPDRRYWFKDKLTRRCFQILVGESDELSGVRLLEVRDNRRAVFQDEASLEFFEVEFE